MTQNKWTKLLGSRFFWLSLTNVGVEVLRANGVNIPDGVAEKISLAIWSVLGYLIVEDGVKIVTALKNLKS
jgi:hypothetical protein